MNVGILAFYGYTMSIPLLVYYVLAKMMSAIESVPLGNGILDHLVSNAELSREMALSLFRRNLPPEEIINTGKYEGYIYNQNRCIQFNNRILCGYDKNKGVQLDDYTMIDMGSGCRARGDRIECGYDNPKKVNTNLRHPDIKHGKHNNHGKHDKHGENKDHDVPHSEHVDHKEHDVRHSQHGEHKEHNVPHKEHGVPHGLKHHHHHHHGEKHHYGGVARQAPTRTPMTTDPTIQTLNTIESDYLENDLLKSAFDKHEMEAEDTRIISMKLRTETNKPTSSTTDAIKPLATTTIKPTQPKSTLTPTSSKSTGTTSTTEITKTLATSTVTNAVSVSQTIKQIVKRAPPKIEEKKRRRLTETYFALPKLINIDNPKIDTTTVSSISNPYETTSNVAVLPMIARNEEKISRACVEQGDRVVCYDFKA